VGGAHGGGGRRVRRCEGRAAEQLFPAFQSLGMTDVASNMEFTEYDADEFYVR
jgi:hypothetical protein